MKSERVNCERRSQSRLKRRRRLLVAGDFLSPARPTKIAGDKKWNSTLTTETKSRRRQKVDNYILSTSTSTPVWKDLNSKALSTLATIVAEFGDCRQNGDFGDKLSGDYSRQIVASVDEA